MRVIFLDIDGVMTSNALIEENGMGEKLYPFSKSSVIALNEILAANKAKIILTSSWRTVFSVEKQCQVFEENGVQQFPRGETIDLGFENRSQEIRDYLNKHTVDGFVILDDMEIEGFDEHFLRIDPDNGLTMNHVKMVNRILATPWNG